MRYQHGLSSPMPWFQRRAGVTIVVALVLFGAVLGLRLLQGADAGQAITMLFVLPIALLAVAFGLRGGVASGLFAVLLVAAWVQVADVPMTAVGWLSRIVPLMLLGTLLGSAADMQRRADMQRHALEIAALRQHKAVEINDTLVQGMAAAKWSLEAGRVAAGLETLNHTLALGHRLVSELMHEADTYALPLRATTGTPDRVAFNADQDA